MLPPSLPEPVFDTPSSWTVETDEVTVGPRPQIIRQLSIPRALVQVRQARLFEPEQEGFGMAMVLHAVRRHGPRTNRLHLCDVWLVTHPDEPQPVGAGWVLGRVLKGIPGWMLRMDMWVNPEWRGRGIGKDLARGMQQRYPSAYGFHTETAEALYRNLGVPDGYDLSERLNHRYGKCTPEMNQVFTHERDQARAWLGLPALPPLEESEEDALLPYRKAAAA